MMNLKEKADTFSWVGLEVEKLKMELDPFRREEILLPTEPGGWWHQYVCPQHHTELIFDAMEQDAVVFSCPKGCKLEGEPYRGAWLVYRHQAMARYALQAAAVFAADGEEFYSSIAQKILVGYAEQFPLYPVHPDAQPWMLSGRAFHQALTEAIWSTTLIRAYLLLVDHGVTFTEEEELNLQAFFTMLEESMEQYRHILIYEKKNAENNYTAWLNASLACVYAAKGTREKLASLLEGEGGFYQHLSIGVKSDGFEFEGSTYYHIFVLRAYLIAAEMAGRFGVDLYEAKGDQGQSIRGMFQLLVELSGDNGELPAVHDGPYARVPFARETAEVFEIGDAVYKDPSLQPILANAYRYLYGQGLRTGLEAVLYGVGESKELQSSYRVRDSVLLPDSGFAMLRHPDNPLSVLADFGEHGGSHGHFDKLHITIMHRWGEVTPELGMVPYGSVLRKEWYSETASHNTVTIGARSQAPHTGSCRQFRQEGNATYLWIRSDGAYEGAVLDRHLVLADGWLLDWFHVEQVTERDEEVDLWFHPTGHLVLPFDPHRVQTDSPTVLGLEAGYDSVEVLSVMKNETDCTLNTEWNIRYDGVSTGRKYEVSTSTLLAPGSIMHEIRTPGIAEDPSRLLRGIMLRHIGPSVDFITVYRDGHEPAVLKLVSQAGELPRIQIATTGQRIDYCLDPKAGLIQEESRNTEE
ncbi:heparinase II/III family protein [Paenibacillus sp. B2(2019)]|uniref:heparinase II/III domain-containing protein n=1 Tax=Paenibacillus sp. B2(2019) TaxID=2607754 RepID=UPI0011F1D883|nr:heparinase II/III family protein [Paenibacillus sp. B2(2019)]KAA1190880.1 alginate lyase family protein [Paenibacillus sp. B2(2019)]